MLCLIYGDYTNYIGWGLKISIKYIDAQTEIYSAWHADDEWTDKQQEEFLRRCVYNLIIWSILSFSHVELLYLYSSFIQQQIDQS